MEALCNNSSRCPRSLCLKIFFYVSGVAHPFNHWCMVRSSEMNTRSRIRRPSVLQVVRLTGYAPQTPMQLLCDAIVQWFVPMTGDVVCAGNILVPATCTRSGATRKKVYQSPLLPHSWVIIAAKLTAFLVNHSVQNRIGKMAGTFTHIQK